RSRRKQPCAPRRRRASLPDTGSRGPCAQPGESTLSLVADQSVLLGRLPQDQVAFRRWQREGKLPDSVFHPNPENKILTGLPRADPFVAGREEDPAVGFGITRIQRHPGRIEALRAHELDELGGFLFVFSQVGRLFLADFWILLDLALGFEDQRVDVVLQFV